MSKHLVMISRRKTITFVLVALCLVASFGLSSSQAGTSLAQTPERPNIVLILADDMMTSDVEHMPQLNSLLTARGTTFGNAFVTDSICCPSRASILRGQYPHNHGVLTVDSAGAFHAFHSLGRESSTVATWLQEGGYRTILLGKYFNGYDNNTYIPPGWEEWYGTGGVGTQFNENGTLVTYDPTVNNPTDVLAEHATQYIERTSADPRPFFMYLAPKPPHLQATVAARHQDAFADAKAPRAPSFNEQDVSDKPSWVRSKPLLSPEKEELIDQRYRERLQKLLALDELVGRVVARLETTGELDNTYLFFTSDNGFHMGQHRLMPTKQTAYEEDIRVPLIVRGPDVPAGRVLNHSALNNDFAPTFAELAGVPTPDFVDGRSLGSLLSSNPTSIKDWRSAFLVEKWGNRVMPYPYKAVRTLNYSYVEYDETGEQELYDLRSDPYQLQSQHASADPAFIEHLSLRVKRLSNCAGASCRTAEGGRSEYVAPTINLTTPARGEAYVLNHEITADYRCEDEAGGSGLKSCDGPVPPGSPIDTGSVGLKGFAVAAEDNAGNRDSATIKYRVRYKFRGFSSPVNNPPTLNAMEAGRAVPVRFGLGGDQGLEVFAEGYPRSEQVPCDPATPVDGIEQTVRAATSSLSYDAGTQRYEYTWKTDPAWAGTCRQLVMKLKDGTSRRADFKFE